MVMGPNFSTQSNATHYVADIDPTQPISPDYNSIIPNTGCYNAINRETVITSLKKLFSQHGTDFSINIVTFIRSQPDISNFANGVVLNEDMR